MLRRSVWPEHRADRETTKQQKKRDNTMGTIFDYFDWRGDLLFSADPFNEADNLALNEMAYAHIENYIGEEERITIAEAASRYFAGDNNPDFVLGVEALRRMGSLPRFRDLELYHLETYQDEETQFGAFCLDLPDGTTYIIFRGTDETITGWREDFAISYMETTSQSMAVHYLYKYVKGRKQKYLVGGHSKGGNLAVYASMRLSPGKQALIRHIYNFDGPGISRERLHPESFAAIRDKISRYVPSYCVVGRLFEQEEIPAVVVDSCGKGILQHDAKNWMVMGTKLVRTDFTPGDCKMTNAIFKKWIESVDMDEREAFTKEFFDALEFHGAETMAEFKKNGIKGVWNLVYSVAKFSPPARKAFAKLLKSTSRNVISTGTGKISATVSWLADKAMHYIPAAGMPDEEIHSKAEENPA